MFKKFVIGLSIVAMLAMAACGGPQVTPTPVPPTTAPAQVPPTQAPTQAAPAGGVVKATPGKAVKMVLLPKFLGDRKSVV